MQKFDIDAMEEQISQALEASTSIMNESTTNKSFDTANELVPCNRNATHVFEVYKLEDFISHSELDSFNDLAIKLNKDPSASERSDFNSIFLLLLVFQNSLIMSILLHILFKNN